jgi:hypothetical protein
MENELEQRKQEIRKEQKLQHSLLGPTLEQKRKDAERARLMLLGIRLQLNNLPK